MAVTCVFEPSGGLGGSVGGGGGSSRAQQEDQVAQLYAGAAFGDEQRTVRRPSRISQNKPYLLLHYPVESEQTTAESTFAAGTQAGAVSERPPPIQLEHDTTTTSYATLDANCDNLNCSTFKTSPPPPQPLPITSEPYRGPTNNEDDISGAFINGKRVQPPNRCLPGLDQKTSPASRHYQSLESIHSAYSSSCSSATDHPTITVAASPSTSTATSHHPHPHHRHHRRRNQRNHHNRHQAAAATQSGPSSPPALPLGSRSNSVLVGTRYVSPPRLADDYKLERQAHNHDDDVDFRQRPAPVDESDWQTIELNDVSCDGRGNNYNRDGLVAANLDPRRSFWSIDAAHAISHSGGSRVPLANNFRFTRFASLVSSFKSTKPHARGGSDALKSSSVNLGGAGKHASGGGGGGGKQSGGGNRNSTTRALSNKQFSDDSFGEREQVKSPAAADQCKRKQSGSDKKAGGGGARKSVSGSVGGPGGADLNRRSSKAQIGIREAPFMFAGILASMLGSVFFSVGMLCIKLLPDDHGGLVEKNKLVFFRGIILMVLCAASIIYSRSTFLIKRDELLVNVFRSLFGFAGVYGCYVSLKYISMGDSTALVFSSPVWTSLLSHFILNEPLKWIQLIALPASFLGIVLIAHPALLINLELEAGATERQPVLDLAEVLSAEVVTTSDQLSANESSSALAATTPLPLSSSSINQTLLQTINSDLDIATNASEHFDYEHRWKGIVIALATSLIVSLVYIVLKFRKTTPIQTTTFWLGFATTSLSGIIMCFIGFGEWPQGWRVWALILGCGTSSWVGQVLLQWALLYDDASVLSVIRTLDVAMTFTLSALFLDEQILWTSVLGAAIIAAVVVSIMLNSWLTKKLCPARQDAVGGVDDELDFDDPTPPAALTDSVKALKYAEANGAGGHDCECQDKHQVAILSGARRESSATSTQTKKNGPGSSAPDAAVTPRGAETVESRQMTAAA